MSKNYTIDTVFKNQLNNMELDNADEMWQRMEQKLVQQKEKQDGKRYLLFLLLLLPVAAGFIITAGKKDKEASISVSFKNKFNNKSISKYNTATAATERLKDTALVKVFIANSTAVFHPQWFNFKNRSDVSPGRGGSISIENTNSTGIGNIGIADNLYDYEPFNDVNPYLLEPDKTAAERKNVVRQGTMQTALVAGKKIPATTNTLKPAIDKNTHREKIQLAITAGTDLTGKLQNNGKYGMVLLHIPLNKSSSLELGAGISSHNTSQSYIVAEKQATLNREIDAKLRELTMLQFPILYRQKIGKTKFLAKAGLTPVYITNAAVTNVPNSFVGVVIPYRSFSLNDINRFNVLFTAGVHYNITPKAGVEIRANYGLTELVKNGYLNQSNENNNFKAVQLGLTWSLGKKR
jgi:Outer membrane protein beta-barrel domain